jgi:hypothetical protein
MAYNRGGGHTAIMVHGGRFFKGARRLPVPLVAVAAMALLAASCQPGTNLGISLPPTPQLFGSLPWGLVNVTYTKGYAEPSVNSAVAVILRGGDVVKIIARAQQQEKIGVVYGYWYQVELDGRAFWIFGNQLSMYGLEIQARTASELVREKLFMEE